MQIMEDDWKKTLFDGYTFRLKGLKSEVEKAFIKIIQDLGGKVSDDGDYHCILTDPKYFKKCKGALKNELYCLHFIRDSITARKPQNIFRYNFSRYLCTSDKSRNDTENHSTLNVEPLTEKGETIAARQCYNSQQSKNQPERRSKLQLKIDPNKRRTSPGREDRRVLQVSQSRNPFYSKSQLEINSAKSTITSHRGENYRALEELRDRNRCRPELSVTTNPNKRKASPERGEDRRASKELQNQNQHRSNELPVNINPKRRKVSLEREDRCTLDVSQNRNPNHSKIHSGSNSVKSTITSHKGENRRAPEEPHNQDQCRSKFQVKMNATKRQILPERAYWFYANIPNATTERVCKTKECTFEPGLHRKHPPPQPELSLQEEKIIIKFLIEFNLIERANERLTFKKMRKIGYLTHRRSSTLRTHFVTQILREIDEYGLPSEIIGKFKNLRLKV